jgi:hypothetical protein
MRRKSQKKDIYERSMNESLWRFGLVERRKQAVALFYRE